MPQYLDFRNFNRPFIDLRVKLALYMKQGCILRNDYQSIFVFQNELQMRFNPMTLRLAPQTTS